MSAAATQERSGTGTEQDSFGRLLHAEWTKFRTVRGWVIAMVVAAAVTAGVGLYAASGPQAGCQPVTRSGQPAGPPGPCHPSVPVGPGGEAVSDSFYFVHQTLRGNGSITIRVTSLTGRYSPNGGIAPGPDPAKNFVAGIQPWAKAGIIITPGTRPGSPYVAMMVTGHHGVRMQDDYTQDAPGLPGAVSAASPRWLRLVRAGDTLTGYDSADGTRWTLVGSASLPGLPAAVQAGLFATSPAWVSGEGSGPSEATAIFDHLSMPGARSASAWRGQNVGADEQQGSLPGGFHQAGAAFTVTGSGDIAPTGPGSVLPGKPADDGLVAAFAGLIVVIVVGVMFITAEYRRGLIRTTFTASPGRARVLAAKAVVIGLASFAAGLIGAAPVVPFGERLLRYHGNYVFPMSALTEVRVVAGTAALLAVAAVFALAAGAILRHGAGAITVVIALIVVTYFFSVPLAVLPAGAADWLLRVTPAAGFAIQQYVPAYPQVNNAYTPQNGYFPLAPWAGLAVVCAWAALALCLAAVLLRRRDA
jgi:ABC-type transport system involved in multi-copper enzyme maturation permease subunit